jgi:hypothetical protein
MVKLGSAAVSLAMAGCSVHDICLECDTDTPPTVLQVFVSNGQPDDDGSCLALAYGAHPAVAGGAPAVGERAAAVPRVMPRFRIVVDELLDGTTLEEFACAGGGFTTEVPCAACADDRATPEDESGRCRDENDDRVPDLVRLQDGVAAIRCPRFLYITAQGDGYYYPSGNQLEAFGGGLERIGPAIVIEPRVTLPANASCTLHVLPGIVDKQGEPLVGPPAGIPFRTAAD